MIKPTLESSVYISLDLCMKLAFGVFLLLMADQGPDLDHGLLES